MGRLTPTSRRLPIAAGLALALSTVVCTGTDDTAEPADEWPDALAPPNERSLTLVDYRLELNGGGERLVIENLLEVDDVTVATPSRAAWSLSGRYLAYVRSAFTPAGDPEAITPEGATLTVVDTTTGERSSTTAHMHDQIVFVDDLLVSVSDYEVRTIDPASGEQERSSLRGLHEPGGPGRLVGATNAGVVFVSTDGSHLEPSSRWTAEVALVRLDGSVLHLATLDDEGAEVGDVAYEPASMMVALATNAPVPGTATICERDGRLATAPLGSPELSPIPLPAAPAGRRWQVSSAYYGRDGRLLVELTDYPQDCSNVVGVAQSRWYEERDRRLFAVPDVEQMEATSGTQYDDMVSGPLVWSRLDRFRAALNARTAYRPPDTGTTAEDSDAVETGSLEHTLEAFFGAWMAADVEGMRARADDSLVDAMGPASDVGDSFDVLWDDATSFHGGDDWFAGAPPLATTAAPTARTHRSRSRSTASRFIQWVEGCDHGDEVQRGQVQLGELVGVADDPVDVLDVLLLGQLLPFEHAGLGIEGEHACDVGREWDGDLAGAAAEIHDLLGAVEAEPFDEMAEEGAGVPRAVAGVVRGCGPEQLVRVVRNGNSGRSGGRDRSIVSCGGCGACLTGLEIVDPGIVPVHLWRPDETPAPDDAALPATAARPASPDSMPCPRQPASRACPDMLSPAGPATAG